MHSTIATVFLAAAAASLTNAAAVVKRGDTSSSSSSQTECQGKGAYYVCANNNFRGYCSVDPCAKPWCPDFQAGTCLPPTVIPENKSDKTTVTVTETVTTTTCTESNTPTPLPPKKWCAASVQYYVCANNGFGGYCSTDPCAKAWCPDYKPHTYDCADDASEDPSTSTAVYSTSTVLSSSTTTYTPSTATPCSTVTPTFTTVYTTPTPVINTKPVTGTGTCAAGLGYYHVCSNGFTGCCKQDACAGAKPVCPGAEAQTTAYAA